MTFARLGVEIVDVRTLDDDSSVEVRLMWHSGMRSLLSAGEDFPFRETCDNRDACLGDLYNAYIDHAEAARANNREPMRFEEYSAANFDRIGIPDFISKPHLALHWFGIRPTGQRGFTGALLISNIEQVKQDSRLLTLSGWPVAVHPAVGVADVATVAGAVARFLMDNDLVTEDPNEADVDFVQWRLPKHPASKYTVRGNTTYGRDVFEEMADGTKVRFDEDAPVEVKRELQPEDEPAEYPDYTRPTRSR